MAKGGYRVGSGRPKGAKNVPKEKADVPKDIERAAKKSGLSPLEYMLNIMNDEDVDGSRRDRMAVAAAPFVHAKADLAEAGKKAQKQAKAEEAAGKFAPRTRPSIVVNNG